ncbi:o-succinylbenzoate--CoA ligase [Sphingobium chlorophenolicum L-1]|uniref:O-succinylbenzoate--CoA ligase n=1 Tax=Sphingobium chlorophenolicum L-1 TaxID=690566 RepID=F6EYY7_SPHCR|nr:acyl-CoA synthetase [Sphingobium chlorophenolicum]AEG48379.1 o-succinylbenzoate--CoA ligase [Sphingobium chlorophenolicum L-1]
MTTATIISGSRNLPPAALDRQIERAAAAMLASGVKPGDAVALLLRNDFAFFSASLAARWIGAFAMPINWHATPDEIGYILDDSGAKLLIAHDDLAAPLAGQLAGRTLVAVPTPPEITAAYGLAPSTPLAEATTWDAWLPDDSTPAPPRGPGGASSLIYTSGTTGKPKGVRRRPFQPEHLAAQAEVAVAGYGLDPSQPLRVLMTGPMYHSAPNAYGLVSTDMAERIVLEPRFDAEELLALVQEHRITHMHMVPTMFVRLLKLPPEVRAKYDISSLKFVVHGAAPCPMEIKRQMIDWWGPVIHEYYGSTETGLVTGHGSAEALAKPGTVGRALPGVTMRAIGEDGKDVEPGAIGDIYVHSRSVPDFSYHGRDDEKSEIERAGFVTVGDIGWIDEDGFLFLCDRRRDMIISGGVNIYPAEVEAALLTIGGVRDCAVFGIPDAEFGEAVCAYVEPDDEASLDAAGIRTRLADTLSRYKIPKVVEFAASLPREDSGKIFKRRLREAYWGQSGRAI